MTPTAAPLQPYLTATCPCTTPLVYYRYSKSKVIRCRVCSKNLVRSTGGRAKIVSTVAI